jgi:hypothetical protein
MHPSFSQYVEALDPLAGGDKALLRIDLVDLGRTTKIRRRTPKTYSGQGRPPAGTIEKAVKSWAPANQVYSQEGADDVI